MSSVKSPQEKKRLSYDRDHYNRAGQHNKSWRRTKPAKKRKATHSFRKSSNDLLKVTGGADEVASANAERKRGSVRQKTVSDYGSIHLKDFVANRKTMRTERTNSRKIRQRKG